MAADDDIDGPRVYSPTQVTVASFFGTWLVGYWMLGANSRALDDGRRWRDVLTSALTTTLYVAFTTPVLAFICFTVALLINRLIVAPQVPAVVSSAFQLTGLLVGPAVVWIAAARDLGDRADRYANKRGAERHHSNLRVAALCAIPSAATVATVAFLFVILTDRMSRLI